MVQIFHRFHSVNEFLCLERDEALRTLFCILAMFPGLFVKLH